MKQKIEHFVNWLINRNPEWAKHDFESTQEMKAELLKANTFKDLAYDLIAIMEWDTEQWMEWLLEYSHVDKTIIPDWDLEFNDLFEWEQPDEPGMGTNFDEIKEHYASLRYYLNKIDAAAGESIYALEQIDTISSYTDFDLDELRAQLDSIQEAITNWQESMRLI